MDILKISYFFILWKGQLTVFCRYVRYHTLKSIFLYVYLIDMLFFAKF